MSRYATFTIDISIDLDESEIWPDGVPSYDWDADDVARSIPDGVSIVQFIQDWGLDSEGAELTIHAYNNGDTTQTFSYMKN